VNLPAQDAITATRIYADFKWTLKIRQHTHQSIDAEISKSIERCERELLTPEVKAATIQKFNEMRNRLSEFTV